MLKFLRIAMVAAVSMVSMAAGMLALILLTEKGASLSWSVLQSQLPEIQAERVSGSLWRGVEIRQFKYQDDTDTIAIDPVRVEIDFPGILRGKAVIDRISLGDTRYRHLDGGPEEPETEDAMEIGPIPFLDEIAVRELSVESFVYENTGWSALKTQAFARLRYRPEKLSWVLDSQASTDFSIEKCIGSIDLEIQGLLAFLTANVKGASNVGDLDLRLQSSDLLTQPGFELEADLKKIDPEILLGQNIGLYELHLKAAGNTEKVGGDLTISQLARNDVQPVDHLAFLFSADLTQLQISNLSASIGKKPVLQGTILTRYAEWARPLGDLKITGLNLAQIRPDLPNTDLQGDVVVRPGAANAQIRLEISDPNLGNLNGMIGITPEDVELETLKFNSPSGSAEISGRFSFSGDQAFSLTARTRDFNPGDFVKDLDGGLSFSLITQGSIQPLAVDARMKFDPGSSLKSQPLSGSLTFNLSGNGVAQGAGGLSWGDSRIALQSNDKTLDIRFKKVNPKILVDDLDAELSGTSRLVFQPDTIQLDLEVGAPAVRFRDLLGEKFSATIRGKSTRPEDLAIGLRIASIDVNAGQARFEDLEFKGTPSGHQLTTSLFSGDTQVKVAVSGAYKAPMYRGSLNTFSIDTGQRKQFTLAKAAPFEAGPKSVSLGPVILKPRISTSESQRLEVALKLDLERYRLQSAGRLDAFDLQWLGLLTADRIPQGLLSADWDLTYDSSSAPLSGRLTTKLSGLKAVVDQTRSIPPLAIENASFSAAGLGTELKAELLVTQNQQNGLQSQIRAKGLPGLQTLIEQDFNLKNIPLSGQGSLKLDDLSMLTTIEPRLASSSGRLGVQARVSGSLENPFIEGNAQLTEFDFAVPEMGLKATVPIAEVKFDGRSLELTRLEFLTPDSKGSASATGSLSLVPVQLGNFTLALKGSSLQIIDQDTFKLTVSPDLQLSGTADTLDIQGDIRVDKGLFTDPSAKEGVSLSSDVVMADAESVAEPAAPETSGKGIRLKINVDIPKSFAVKAFGADLLLGGNLKVLQTRAGIPVADGRLAVVNDKFTKNTYTAYGQVLQIKKGSLLFARSPINDPGLDIVSVRKVRVGEVGVHVTGTASAPEIQLQSDPAMADSEILSWLVLGRPASEAGKGFGALLLAASSEFTGGGSLVDQTREWIGLDELSFGSQDDTTSGIVTLGKRIGENLYLNYQQGILEQGYKIKAIYQLTPAWSLIAESARVSNAVEIEWSKRF